MDLPELGNGSQTSTSPDQGGIAPTIGSKPAAKKWNVNIENRRAWHRQEYQLKKAAKQERAREYYRNNRERVLLQKAQRRLDFPDEVKGKMAAYRKNKRVERSAYNKKWVSENKDRKKAYLKNYLPRRRELSALRRAENPNRRLAENTRGRIYNLVKRFNPSSRYKTYALLGCTPDFFRNFLEAQFKTEMNWDNYGTYWEIDHIIPVSKFDLKDPVQIRQAFHYSNCRPLEAEKNASKNDTLPGPHQALLI